MLIREEVAKTEIKVSSGVRWVVVIRTWRDVCDKLAAVGSQVYSQGSAFYHGWLDRGETVVVVICEGGWSSSRLNITHLILLLLMC